jgi:hypothetical protein
MIHIAGSSVFIFTLFHALNNLPMYWWRNSEAQVIYYTAAAKM